MFPDTIANTSSFDPKEWVDEQDRLALKAFKSWKKEVLKDNKSIKPVEKNFEQKEISK